VTGLSRGKKKQDPASCKHGADVEKALRLMVLKGAEKRNTRASQGKRDGRGRIEGGTADVAEKSKKKALKRSRHTRDIRE